MKTSLRHRNQFLNISIVLVGALLLINLKLLAASGPGDVVGKVTVGYQGWFSAAGDGSPVNSWQHDNLEMWPDVRAYPSAALFSGCPFYQAGVQQPGYTGNLGNGQPAKMFSTYNQQLINLHFQWMQQNGIDTVAKQRFGSSLPAGNNKNFMDAEEVMIMNAAQSYGRKFFIMYDCSTVDATNVLNDWKNRVAGSAHLTSSTAYAKQNGKPVVALWGVGKSGRGTAADWVTLINNLKSAGCYVIGGVMANFSVDTANASAYTACNMVMPWMVGRTGGFFNSYSNDLVWCNAHGIDYQADIYPGTAFYNTDSTTPKNEVPRAHGNLMWSQFSQAYSAGVPSAYISMFDEANEATSIFPVAEDSSMIPAGKYFLTLDADGVHVSSDFYLRLTFDGGLMVKNRAPYTANEPTPFTVVVPNNNSTYHLICQRSGKALDNRGSTTTGTEVDQWADINGEINQEWKLVAVGGGYYNLVCQKSGMALDNGGSTANGSVVTQWTVQSGNINQQWQINSVGGGYYHLICKKSGKALDNGGYTADGSAVGQWTDQGVGNPNQNWRFEFVR